MLIIFPGKGLVSLFGASTFTIHQNLTRVYVDHSLARSSLTNVCTLYIEQLLSGLNFLQPSENYVQVLYYRRSRYYCCNLSL
jgi:hypothetical protein